MKKEKNVINKVFITCLIVFLIVYALSITFMLLWGTLTSLKHSDDYFANKLGLPSLEYSRKEFLNLYNYLQVFKNFEFPVRASFYSGGQKVIHRATMNIGSLLLNTIIYAGTGALLHAFVPCLVAYLCVKYPFKLSKIIYNVCLLIMIIPIIGAQPSEISLLRSLGLYDTWLGYFCQKMNFTGMYFFVFHAYFRGLPDAYTEAAEVDGASQTSILFRIILPLVSKMIATVMLILFVQLWNDYQTPLLYLPTKATLAYGVYYMAYAVPIGSLSQEAQAVFGFTPGKIAACMVLALPILVLFIFLKDKLMGNVSVGGIKD